MQDATGGGAILEILSFRAWAIWLDVPRVEHRRGLAGSHRYRHLSAPAQPERLAGASLRWSCRGGA